MKFCVQKREAKNKNGKLPKKASQYDDEMQTNSSRGRRREIETETNGTNRYSSRGIANGNRWDKTADSDGDRSPDQLRRSSSYSNPKTRRHPDANVYDDDDAEESFRNDGRYHPLHKATSSPDYSLAGNGRPADIEYRTSRPLGGGAAMTPLSPLSPLEPLESGIHLTLYIYRSTDSMYVSTLAGT